MHPWLLALLLGCPTEAPSPPEPTPTAEPTPVDLLPYERWTEQSQIAPPTNGHGVAAGDIDGDGWPDLFVPGLRGESQNFAHRLYLNRQDGTFEDASEAWLSRDSFHSAWGVTLVDIDGDDDLDAALAGTSRNRLWRNDGDHFTELPDAGVGGLFNVLSASIAAADFDADGHLDLYVVNHELAGQEGPGVPHPADRLLRNLGDGTFEDATGRLPAGRLEGAGFAAAWTDLDEDGDLDLYLVNDFGMDVPNQYFRNDGGTFVAAEEECSCGLAIEGMGLTVLDYDGDERLDLYLSDRHGERLLRNLGGQMVETTAKHGALGDSLDSSRGTSWGTDVVDFDHDGWPDLVLAFGDEHANDPATNRLFRNLGGRFEEVASGFEDLHDTRGLAVLDFDRDGCDDLAFHGPTGFELYRGQCPDVSWIGFDLDTQSAGARIEVVTDRVQVREVGIGSSSVHGSREPALRFGLADQALVEVIVRRPDGTVARADDLEPGRYHPLP